MTTMDVAALPPTLQGGSPGHPGRKVPAGLCPHSSENRIHTFYNREFSYILVPPQNQTVGSYRIFFMEGHLQNKSACLGRSCPLFLGKVKLRHSPGRPSRSDFVQLKFINQNNPCSLHIEWRGHLPA